MEVLAPKYWCMVTQFLAADDCKHLYKIQVQLILPRLCESLDMLDSVRASVFSVRFRAREDLN
jgi:hypothetical protein